MDNKNKSILFQDKIVLPCVLESVDTISLRLDEWFEHGKVSLEKRNDIHICLDELMSNFVYYSQASEIQVRYVLYDDEIYLSFSDNGVPFNPLAKDTQMEKPEKGKKVQIGGLGIMMVRQMTKKIVYQYDDGRNRLETYFSIA